MELYTVNEYCNYSNVTNEITWNWLLVSIWDSLLLQELQLDTELTPKKAKKLIQQMKLVAEKQQFLMGTMGGMSSSLHHVHSHQGQPQQQTASNSCSRWETESNDVHAKCVPHALSRLEDIMLKVLPICYSFTLLNFCYYAYMSTYYANNKNKFNVTKH